MEGRAQIVYRGHDNTVDVTLYDYNEASRREEPLDFSAVTRMVLVLPTTQPVLAFDSAVTAGVMDWDVAPGTIRFNIQQFAIPVGGYPAQLIAYDPANENGLVIVDETLRPVAFEFREVMSSGLLPPPMPTGGSGVVRFAGETISALRAVYEREGKVYHIDQQDSANIDLFLGISVSSGGPDSEIIVQRDGTLDDGGWNWAVGGVVYVGAAGVLTQTQPVTGWELVVGAAPEATRLTLDFDEPVLLAQEQ